jgi:hypothetical protein
MGEGLNVDDVVYWATWAFLQLGGGPGRSEDIPVGVGVPFGRSGRGSSTISSWTLIGHFHHACSLSNIATSPPQMTS